MISRYTNDPISACSDFVMTGRFRYFGEYETDLITLNKIAILTYDNECGEYK